MALSTVVVWRMRAGGAETNGGGYDGVTYPGGTDYSDQDSPQLSLTDLTSTASTTVTTVLGTFTSNMVGNVLRLASGTGTTTGYYVIATYVSATQVTLDRVSGTYTAGVAKVGGAHASLLQYANGGIATQPVLATPLAAGHTVYIRGAGSDDPSTVDYDYSSLGNNYWTWPQGSEADGQVKIIGYNGRPFINTPSGALMIYASGIRHWVENLKMKVTGNSYSIAPWVCQTMVNIYFDVNGIDAVAISAVNLRNSYIYNSGSTTAGSNNVFYHNTYGGLIENNYFLNLRGRIFLQFMTNFRGNIISGSKVTTYGAVFSSEPTDSSYHFTIEGNTFYNCAGTGLELSAKVDVQSANIVNNIFANNGGYGIKFPNSLAYNDRCTPFCDYNTFYSNTSGTMQYKTAGANDSTANPTFTSTGTGDFSVGTNMKAIGFPALITKSGTTSYVDMGAAQRQEAGGAAATTGYVSIG